MKVCLVSPLPPPLGGIGVWTEKLLDYFSQEETISFEIVDIAPRWRKVHQKNVMLRVVGGSIQFLFNSMTFIKKIRKSDCCHLCTSGSLALFRDKVFIGICRIMRKPIVYHLHFGRVPEIRNNRTKEWYKLYNNISKVDYVVPLDGKTEKTLLLDFDKNKIVKIPNPIHIDDKLCNSESKTVLFVGWNIYSKGIEDLLSAWQNIENKQDWRLVLIGPGNSDYISKIKGQYNTNNVDFIGELEHEKVEEYMLNSSVFVLPSHTEAFPLVILEAMQYGLAVIGTDVGAIPEMLENDSGIVVPVKNPTILKENLQLLLNNSENRKLLGRNAKNRVAEEFSQILVYNKLKALWEQSR